MNAYDVNSPQKWGSLKYSHLVGKTASKKHSAEQAQNKHGKIFPS